MKYFVLNLFKIILTKKAIKRERIVIFLANSDSNSQFGIAILGFNSRIGPITHLCMRNINIIK